MPTCTLAQMLHIMQEPGQPWARLVLHRVLHRVLAYGRA